MTLNLHAKVTLKNNELTKVALVLCLLFPWLNPFAPGPTPGMVPWLFSWFCVFAVFASGVSSTFSAKRLVSVAAWAWLLAGLISSLAGLLQYFGAATEFSPWINQTRYGEAFANLRQRNQFATLTNIGFIALLWLLSNTSVISNTKPVQRAKFLATVCWGCAGSVILMLGNAASSSRTGIFQLVLIVVLSGVWGLSRRFAVHWILGFACLAYGVGAFALPYLAGLDLSLYGVAARLGQDDGCGSRLMLWSNVLHLIAQKPWLGWGWGELDYAHFITLYNGPRFCDILDNAHNLPLHLAVELGVPAATLICGGFIWWVVRQKPWAERDATRQMAWAVIAVILLHSMLEYPLWYGPFQMALGICMILLIYHPKLPSEAKNSFVNAAYLPSNHISYARAATFLIAFMLLGFTAYAAWDYRRISQIYLPPEAREAYYRSDTLGKIRSSWLFADQVQFAELMITPLSQANAALTYHAANRMLHYSPEPRVIEKLIESAVMLGRDDEAMAYLAPYKVAFPTEYALWAETNAKPKATPSTSPG
jgi:O-antigen ligase